MTHCRQAMLEELHRRNYAPSTITYYVKNVELGRGQSVGGAFEVAGELFSNRLCIPPQVSRARSVSRRAVRRISRQECS